MASRRDLLAIGLASSMPVWAQGASGRVALVVGNASYATAPLPNAANDAKAMSEALGVMGFHVVALRDASKHILDAAIVQVRDLLSGRNGVGLLYYAGHGLQLDWRNYLVPVDAEMRTATDVPRQGVDIQVVIDAFRAAGTRTNIVVLDACRDNPFNATSGVKGLAPLDAPPGTFLAYATAPGNVAEDGTSADGNGLYTRFLLKEIQQPNAKIEDIFKRVRLQVRRASHGRQVPWESTSLEDDFVFATGAKLEKESGLRRDAAFEEEKAAWDRVKVSERADDVYAFLARFPNGFLAEVAQARLEHLQKATLKRSSPFKGPLWMVGDKFERDLIDGFTGNRRTVRFEVTQADAKGVALNGGQPVGTLDGGILEVRGDRFDPPIYQYPLDIAAGKRWRSAFQVTHPGGYTSRNYWDFKVVTVESITVPAGTFRAYKIEGSGEGTGARGLSVFRMTYWLDEVWLKQVKTELLIRHNGKITFWERSEMRSLNLVPRPG